MDGPLAVEPETLPITPPITGSAAAPITRPRWAVAGAAADGSESCEGEDEDVAADAEHGAPLARLRSRRHPEKVGRLPGHVVSRVSPGAHACAGTALLTHLSPEKRVHRPIPVFRSRTVIRASEGSLCLVARPSSPCAYSCAAGSCSRRPSPPSPDTPTPRPVLDRHRGGALGREDPHP